MRVKKDSRNFLISLKCSLQKLWNFLHAGKKSFWGSMFSLMTLQNSMDERKLKNYQALISVYSLYECVYMCVCVCVQGRPCVCEVEWRGLSFQCDSEEGWGEGEGERETDKHGLQRLCSHCDLNQMETELHFLTECSKYTDIRRVYYDKIQQIHPTFTTLPDQEKTSVSARRTQDLLCVCCSICVSLSPQKRRHPVCPELMFPAHVDYIMTYYSIILLKCIFCLYNLILYLI